MSAMPAATALPWETPYPRIFYRVAERVAVRLPRSRLARPLLRYQPLSLYRAIMPSIFGVRRA